jgi:dipeptidyl aminopeptidase/acylaminoacyl peptidase
MRKNILVIGFGVMIAAAAVPLQRGTALAQQNGTPAPRAGALTIDHLVDIKHPSSPVWSPDGRHVVFIWERAGLPNLWIAAADGGSPRALTSFTDGQVGGVAWTNDSRAVLFSRGGDAWRIAIGGAGAAGTTPTPEALWRTPAAEGGLTWSPDRTRVAFTRSHADDGKDGRSVSDLWVRRIDGGQEIKLTDGLGAVNPGAWSPDGRRLTFSVAQATRKAKPAPYSGAKIDYSWIERTSVDQFAIDANGGGKAVAIAPSPESEQAARWIDNERIVLERVTNFTRRQILIADAATGKERVLHEETDAKFVSLTGDSGYTAQPSPDGKWIAYVSDRDGWDHLYVTPTAGGTPTQLTRGRFEAWRPAWSPDSTRLAYDANLADNLSSRHINMIAVGVAAAGRSNGSEGAGAGAAAGAGAQAGGGLTRSVAITSGRGTNAYPQWSPDGSRIVYQHTDPQNSADLWIARAPAAGGASGVGAPVRLGDSLPAGVDRKLFVEPERVAYKGPDGKTVPAYLFVPQGLDRSKKHPAIVWIHGDGVNQNYDGWHVQRNYAVYYSFHQYLLQRGYVVLAPDYRGSIGYGRDWRQGVHLDVGNKDFQDAAMSAEYLKTLPYIDTDRIGVWGLSYGGFFTLLALTDHPTWFRAGINVAGVADYRMYYEDPWHGGWTVSRIGTPDEHPKVYDVASPLSRVDRIVRPLLVLHGTSDVNVPYLHSVRLADELLKKGKDFDFVTYPGEFHYFTREHVLRDAWTRVERFFDLHLRGKS